MSTDVACGVFDGDLNGYSLIFSFMQSSTCVKSKFLFGLALANSILCSLTIVTVAGIIVHEFYRNGIGWSNAVQVYSLGILTAGASFILSVSDIAGIAWLNSIGWYSAYIFGVTLESFVIMLWARISLNLMEVRMLFEGTEEQQILNRFLQNLKDGIYKSRVALHIILIPIFIVRIVLHDNQNQRPYNIVTLVHICFLIPWFLSFAVIVRKFAENLATTVEQTVSDIGNAERISKRYLRSTLTTSIGSPRRPSEPPKSAFSSDSISPTTAGTQHSFRALNGDRLTLLKTYPRKIRFLGRLIIFDKLCFSAAFVSFMIYGSLELTGHRPTPMWNLIGHYVFTVPAGILLVWLCVVYQFSVANNNSGAIVA
ncbi:uncharacterized protein SPPG_02151 [Spizellomyces punctatus DAOM BR117]|uniref:Uncharacterized protein n=1 Tax=Spizellomyces punctatus (strain DAOM BR117) TaxID=645134 RepID=A0A0L0HPT3_SPIPD|nr:uncharacterized protein SPPG_02151 [Spizellomyces punctatus DAOM BR117]KND03087.1 hypothetical protein SPPG_02151 [Spizellomyces punctatus DAOM BR117]|eukprot:XP_016611126.1 hypothetical protein SPPG_02151 [Spizellomyces punctatus DAOM BR117]